MLDKLSLRNDQPTTSQTTIGRLIGDLKKAQCLPKRVKLSLNETTGKLHETK